MVHGWYDLSPTNNILIAYYNTDIRKRKNRRRVGQTEKRETLQVNTLPASDAGKKKKAYNSLYVIPYIFTPLII